MLMQNFVVGDLVVVREDITAEERQIFPHFVPEMEECVGHIYVVSDTYFTLGRCSTDQWAPDPSGWSWNELWCRPMHPVTEDELDLSAVFELV